MTRHASAGRLHICMRHPQLTDLCDWSPTRLLSCPTGSLVQGLVPLNLPSFLLIPRSYFALLLGSQGARDPRLHLLMEEVPLCPHIQQHLLPALFRYFPGVHQSFQELPLSVRTGCEPFQPWHSRDLE